ncbi:MAG TPA: tetratricopeptide repeat protein [Pyrinomonadaceae bacterium]|nr:tetratricopeptide repeat protein [Pyrinomonadaceae bacterium]
MNKMSKPPDAQSFARPLAPLLSAALILACALAVGAAAQGGGHILWGDVKVDESKAEGQPPLSFDIVLYTDNGNQIGRQSVPNKGRYRFMDLANGNYDLVVEVEGAEVARMRVRIVGSGAMKSDYQQDIEMEWRARPSGAKAGNVAAADFYKRTPAAQKLYDRAEEALTAKRYPDAVSSLQQLVGADAQDYQAWTELGTAYLLQNNAADSEKSYLRAIEVRPAFALAYLDLARLRMAEKNYDGAMEVLSKAVVLQPPSADANLLLGESYLQLKKGSKAVPYLEEAARLGKPEARLRLATLYDHAGMKDRAASEYEQFLAAKPDYPDRKKLEQYIKENKKQ